MQRNALETLIGAIVLLVAACFLIFAYKGSEASMSHGSGYTVKAKFSNATGIATGSDVRIGGIKIGVVEDMKLDPKSYDAIAFLHLDQSVGVPTDSSAAIASSGLLGEKFVAISPGGDEKMLKEGGTIKFTQSSVSLEELIGKFVFSAGGVDKGGNKGAGSAPAAPAPAPAATTAD